MVQQIKNVLDRTTALGAAATLLLAALMAAVPLQTASAAALLDRSLQVTSSSPGDETTNGANLTVDTAGHPNNGAEVGHTYTFTPFTSSTSADTIKAITVSYCSTPFGYLTFTDGNPGDDATECIVPTGFDADTWNGATVEVTDGVTPTNFTIAATGDRLTLTNATGIDSGAATLTVSFPATDTNHFVNPFDAYIGGATDGTQNPTGTYFAHLITFNSDTVQDTTTDIDEGTVTNNITNSISIETRVQETLNFSVEGDELEDGASSVWASGTCTPLTADGSITMGDSNNALASDTAFTADSYFRLATNSSDGASVFYAGETLTSGTNTITEIGASAVASTTGGEQFGLAFDLADTANANRVGDAGGDLVPITAYSDASAGYAFVASTTAPVLLAQSPGVVQCDTGSVQYVANISTDTEAGIYTTKINYIAAPSY